MSVRPPGVPLGRYVLGERLAIGGMGEVYVALQLGLGRFEKPLALKLLLPHLTEDARAVEMFLDEAHLAARMNHPNVLQIFDVGVEAGRYFIAMELIRGVSMATLIKAALGAQVSVPASVVGFVGRALCAGLHHAHELSDSEGNRLEIVHRDVTPHNVLLSGDGAVKLSDFGIAKARDTSAFTRPGSIKGKLAYVAPEQVQGRPADRRSDIFGAAITLFQFATLQNPFGRENDAATLRAVETEKLPNLKALRPDLPDELVAAVTRAASKDPADRFSTAKDFEDALPLSSADAAGELGLLVSHLCGSELRVLQEKTAHAISLASSPEGTLELATTRKWWPVAAGGALAALAVTAAWVGFRRPSPEATSPDPKGEATSVIAPPAAPAPAVRNDPVEVAMPAPEPTADAGAAEPASHARPRRLVPGYLTVDATPWASVFVGGKLVGETPLARLPVEPGLVDLTFKNGETSKVVKKRVRVEAGKNVFVRVNLR